MVIRPIDANTLYNAFNGWPGSTISKDLVLRMIANSSSLPVITEEQLKERMRGYWNLFNDDENYNPYGAVCSECGVLNEERTNFCPNCGAAMYDDAQARLLKKVKTAFCTDAKSDERTYEKGYNEALGHILKYIINILD